jgi:hypothetical protein
MEILFIILTFTSILDKISLRYTSINGYVEKAIFFGIISLMRVLDDRNYNNIIISFGIYFSRNWWRTRLVFL